MNEWTASSIHMCFHGVIVICSSIKIFLDNWSSRHLLTRCELISESNHAQRQWPVVGGGQRHACPQFARPSARRLCPQNLASHQHPDDSRAKAKNNMFAARLPRRRSFNTYLARDRMDSESLFATILPSCDSVPCTLDWLPDWDALVKVELELFTTTTTSTSNHVQYRGSRAPRRVGVPSTAAR